MIKRLGFGFKTTIYSKHCSWTAPYRSYQHGQTLSVEQCRLNVLYVVSTIVSDRGGSLLYTVSISRPLCIVFEHVCLVSLSWKPAVKHHHVVRLLQFQLTRNKARTYLLQISMQIELWHTVLLRNLNWYEWMKAGLNQHQVEESVFCPFRLILWIS